MQGLAIQENDGTTILQNLIIPCVDFLNVSSHVTFAGNEMSTLCTETRMDTQSDSMGNEQAYV